LVVKAAQGCHGIFWQSHSWRLTVAGSSLGQEGQAAIESLILLNIVYTSTWGIAYAACNKAVAVGV
jgi:hypothetical protein